MKIFGVKNGACYQDGRRLEEGLCNLCRRFLFYLFCSDKLCSSLLSCIPGPMLSFRQTEFEVPCKIVKWRC